MARALCMRADTGMANRADEVIIPPAETFRHSSSIFCICTRYEISIINRLAFLNPSDIPFATASNPKS